MKNAALQMDSEGIELVTHRHLHGSFDWFSQRMLLFTLHTFAIDELSLMEGCKVDDIQARTQGGFTVANEPP